MPDINNITLIKGDNNKRKFLVTMIIIMVCATVINYGLYNVLSIYVKKPSNLYNDVQWSIIYTMIVIIVVTVVMIAIMPKDRLNELLLQNTNGAHMLDANNNTTLSPEEQLQNMLDDELDKENKNN